MIIDDSFYKRVAIARTSLGMTQENLANKVGIGRRQIASYEGGDSKPRKGVLLNLAAALGTSVEWLATGNGQGPDIRHIKRTVTVREVPLLTQAQAFGGEYELEDFLDGTSASDFIPGPPNASEYTFALRVQGDSMQSAGSPSFPDGSIIFVDPQIAPENGDFGIFTIESSQDTTFKQFIIDQGIGYLRPLNPNYPMIPVSVEPEAIGKVIASQQSFKDNLTEYHSPYNPQDYAARSKSKEAIEDRLSVIESKLDYILELLALNKKPT
ncbi:LexA family protein [Citrobacter koseri]|uniref:LexA family protein n=1 Tax=Citrobacter koseri TaxID=545 RepID=UPI003CFD019B